MLYFILLAASVSDERNDVVTQLFLAYEDDILKYTYRKLGNIEDARDAQSETFIRALKNRDELAYCSKEEQKRRLFGYAKLTCIDFWRKKSRTIEAVSINNAESDDNGEVYDMDIKADVNILEELINKDTINYLVKAIEALEPTDQQLVINKVYFEKRNTEIAQEMGINVSTVGTRLSRIFKKLRKDLEEYLND